MTTPRTNVAPGRAPREQLTATCAARVRVPSSLGDLAALDAAGDDPIGSLLLLPGYTGSKEDFTPLLDSLADNGFRALAIDLPGQYESAGPDDEGAYTPLALGAACAGIVTRLATGGPVAVLGHSFGGLVARGAVLAGAPVRGLVLLASGPQAFSSGDRYDALRAGEQLLRRDGKAACYDGTVAVERAARQPVPIDVAEFLRMRFMASSQAGLLGMGSALQTEPDRVDELGRTLTAGGAGAAVITGVDDDAWLPAQQREMAVRLGTDLVLVEHAAHSPAVENPAGLLAVLVPLLHRWFSASSPGTSKSSAT